MLSIVFQWTWVSVFFSHFCWHHFSLPSSFLSFIKSNIKASHYLVFCCQFFFQESYFESFVSFSWSVGSTTKNNIPNEVLSLQTRKSNTTIYPTDKNWLYIYVYLICHHSITVHFTVSCQKCQLPLLRGAVFGAIQNLCLWYFCLTL